MSVLILGLVTGVAFGYILQRVGVARCGCIFDALNLRNLKAVKMMLTAVAVGSLIVYPASALGLVSIGGKTLYVLGVIAGAAIFGAGFAIAGYCPGTALAGLGAGRKDVIAVVIGGLVGAFAYSVVYPWIEPLLIQPLNFGRVSLPDVLGVNPVILGPVFAIILLAVAWMLDRRDQSAQSQPKAATPIRGAAEQSPGGFS